MATAGVLAWMALSWYQTPRFKGKAVKTWIQLASNGNPDAVAALRELGTNAIPDFVEVLGTQDSRLHKAAWKLQRKLNPRLRQAWLKKMGPPIAWGERARAARALASIGPEATWALPYLS